MTRLRLAWLILLALLTTMTVVALFGPRRQRPPVQDIGCTTAPCPG